MAARTPHDTPLAIGRRIAQARTDDGLTARQVASDFGVARQWIEALENGRRVVSAEWLFKFADYYNRSPRWFLSGDDNTTFAVRRR